MSKVDIGLIINPVAGLGGAVGLKGSDGENIQRQAIAMGASAVAPGRAMAALRELAGDLGGVRFLTCSGVMGEDVAGSMGFECQVIGGVEVGRTSAKDTMEAAAVMVDRGVRLIFFAGGDGTARDIATAVGTGIPVVGIPAGVKMHSAVFANAPRDSGRLVKLILEGRIIRFREAEVMDLDEAAYRRAEIVPRLFGYLLVPAATGLVQSQKKPVAAGDRVAQREIAAWICERMEEDTGYILGPGTTTRAIAELLGVHKTLIGVDVVRNGTLIQHDANEAGLLEIQKVQRTKIVVSPIGGQGHIFGRGNQQISASVIKAAGKSGIIIVCTPDKLHALEGKPLRIDSGDAILDAEMSGYYRLITGFDEQAIYRISA